LTDLFRLSVLDRPTTVGRPYVLPLSYFNH